MLEFPAKSRTVIITDRNSTETSLICSNSTLRAILMPFFISFTIHWVLETEDFKKTSVIYIFTFTTLFLQSLHQN